MRNNKSHNAILGMLSIAPMSAYEIGKTMQQSTAHFWAESDGQLYPALNALEKQGLVNSKIQGLSRKKKIYSLTKKGETLLKNWLEEDPKKLNVRDEFLLKIFFCANVPKKTMLRHLENFQSKVQQQLKTLQATKKSLTQKNSSHVPYWQHSVEYGIQISKAKLKWVKQILQHAT